MSSESSSSSSVVGLAAAALLEVGLGPPSMTIFLVLLALLELLDGLGFLSDLDFASLVALLFFLLGWPLLGLGLAGGGGGGGGETEGPRLAVGLMPPAPMLPLKLPEVLLLDGGTLRFLDSCVRTSEEMAITPGTALLLPLRLSFWGLGFE